MEDPPFAVLRSRMVSVQLESRGICDPRVLEAFRSVPRHEFVPPRLRAAAYEDHPLEIGLGQTISQPFMAAAMTELLGLRSVDRALEIGTGSGYQAAILSLLAQEVVTIERHPRLAALARERLAAFGYGNVTVFVGDGSRGAPEQGLFDAIIVTAAAPQIPISLIRQLSEGGRLVCPVGGRMSQTLVRGVRKPEGFVEEYAMGCIFVPLLGAEGWPGEDDPVE